MKVLLVHNSYRQPGGEDLVFTQESALLRRYGHTVLEYVRSNAEGQSAVSGALQTMSNAFWSRETIAEVGSLLAQERPDIVHVHNTYMRISPSVFWACSQAGIAVVQTVHNYRMMCPASSFEREGKPCEECSARGLWRSMVHGCYRDSRTASAMAAGLIAFTRRRGTWHGVSTFIAPTNFVRSKLIAAGFAPSQVRVKSHFVSPDPGRRSGPGEYVVFSGRLDANKGAGTLLEAWQQLPHVPLLIVGEGPQRGELERIVRSGALNVRFAGAVPHEEVMAAVRGARILVFPSHSYETFGLGIAEAFACGVPVIASDLGAMRELVTHGATGLLYPSTDAQRLSECVRSLWSDVELNQRMGEAARAEFELRFTAASNYQQLLTIYEDVRALSPRLFAAERSAFPQLTNPLKIL